MSVSQWWAQLHHLRSIDLKTKKTHTDLRTRKICVGKVYGLPSNNVNKRCLALIHVSATAQHS